MDGEGQICKVEPSTLTAARNKIQWQVYIEAKLGAEMWADFPESDNQLIEVAYVTEKKPIVIGTPDGSTWTIDMVLLVQTNDRTGTARRIRRMALLTD